MENNPPKPPKPRLRSKLKELAPIVEPPLPAMGPTRVSVLLRDLPGASGVIFKAFRGSTRDLQGSVKGGSLKGPLEGDV